MIKDFINKICSFNIKEKLLFNPFIGFKVSSLGDYQGVNNGIKRKIPANISMFAQNQDFQNLSITLFSLLNQSLKPDRVILWVDEKENFQTLPYEITQFIKNGLEIRFIKNKKEYTATYYAIKEFPNSINVIAQCGFYYTKDWFKLLYSSYIQNSDEIHAYLAKEVKIDDKKILSSKLWEKAKNECSSSLNVIDSRGGVLFPPNCFGKDFLREDIFLKYVSANPELWYWVMSLIYKRKVRVVRKAFGQVNYFNAMQIFSDKTDYKLMDNQLENLMKFYGQNIINKIF